MFLQNCVKIYYEDLKKKTDYVKSIRLYYRVTKIRYYGTIYFQQSSNLTLLLLHILASTKKHKKNYTKIV